MKLTLLFLAAAVVCFGTCGTGNPNASQNSITSSVGCAEVDTIVNTPVTQRVDTYSTELRARIGSGAFLYDQTFNVAFSDTTVQNAITTARGVLTGAGAVSFTGPTQLSSNVAQVSSVPVVVNTGNQSSALVGTASFVGPFTEALGDLGICTGYNPNPTLSITGFGLVSTSGSYVIPTGCSLAGTPFTIVGGGIDIHVQTVTLVTINQTTTTTNTFLTTTLYELDGARAGVPVTPAPPALLLTVTALLCGALFLLLQRRRLT